MSRAREQAFWDAEAGRFDVRAAGREAEWLLADRGFAWLASEVEARKPGRVLDAGCGRGATTLELARRVPGAVGIDVSLGSLRQAAALVRARGARAEFALGALEELPFPARSFDVVAGRFVLHHAASLEAAAAEIERVLRPGGAGVFLETWGENPLLRLGRDVAALLGIGLGTEDERPLRAEDLRLLRRRFRLRACFPAFTLLELSNRFWRQLGPWAVKRRSRAERIGRAWTACIRADRYLEKRCPSLRAWGWYVGLVLEKR